MRNTQILFSSSSYDYAIYFWVHDGKTRLELGAACKRTGRISTITTVNEVMSYFGADPNKKRFQDSTWRLKNKEVLKFQNKVAELLAMDDLSWLDEALDADRAVGEWENLIGGE